MYFPYFIAYIAVGLALGAGLFFWALRSGQFRDQQRARFLPLERGEGTGDAKGSRWKRYEIYILFFLAFAGLMSTGTILIYALISGGK